MNTITRKLMLTYLALSLCFTVSVMRAAPAPATGSESDFAAIDAYIQGQMQDLRLPGLALGIVHGDQIVYLKGYGIASPSGQPVTPQTPFIIGSLTKSFTALGIMQLVEAGKIDLDAPVQRYLPWFRVADESASAQITVRHLLTHTSGISTKAGREQPSDLSDSALEQRVRSFRKVQLTQPVGTTYQYSGANYATLGMIIQAISGQSYEAYVQQNILAPLEMQHSFTSQLEAQKEGLATGYRYWFGLPIAADLPYNRAGLPQGYLISTIEDMAHYLIAQLNAGRYTGASILSSAGIASMHQPAVQIGDSNTFYGLGWKVGPTNGVPSVWHDGSVFNYHANMLLIPDGQWGIVILKNAYTVVDEFSGMNRLNGIAVGVTSLLAGKQPPAAPSSTGLLIFYGIPLIIVALQVIGMIRSGWALRGWQSHPERRPSHLLNRLSQIGLPFSLNMAWGLIILVGLPRFFGMPLSMVLSGIPDLGYLLVVSGIVALAWSLLWMAWAFLTLRSANAPAVPAETLLTRE